MEEKWRILIVDDDKAILKSFKEILQLEGYTVDLAETGEEALEMSKTNLYHLALLDIRLRGMQGTKLLKILHGEFPNMKKIMVTGCPSLENAIESLKHGASAYILKPVSPEKLLNAVEGVMKKEEA